MIQAFSFLRKAGLKRASGFVRGESGNATVEAALWLPFFVIALMAAGQVALIFFGQSVALAAAQTGTRAYSVGDVLTPAEAVALIKTELSGTTKNATVNVAVTDNLITTSVIVPASDFGGPLKFVPQFADLNVRVFAQQRKEF